MDRQSAINIAVAFAQKWEQLASKSPDSTKYFSNPSSLPGDTTIYSYPDGSKGYSIGWGSYKTLSDDTPVVYGSTITKSRADKEILAEMTSNDDDIFSDITADLNEYQYAAILDFVYNAGSGGLNYNHDALLNAINNGGDVVGILKKTAITQDGKYLSNLYNRRIDEGLLWNGSEDSLYSMYLRNATAINYTIIGLALIGIATYVHYLYKHKIIQNTFGK